MNGAEAASTLFGPEEPASDPFASLGEEPASQPVASDLFHFNDAPPTFDYGLTRDQYPEQSNATQTQTPQNYAQSASHAFGTDPHFNASPTTQIADEHWRGEPSQWDRQNYAAEHQPNTTQRHTFNGQQYDSSSHQKYESYAPPLTAIPSSAHAPYADSYSTYPSSTSHTAQASTTTSPYSSYGPHSSLSTRSTTNSQYPAQTPFGYQSAPPASAVPTPPAPVPNAPLNRPKANAYDPPFPTTKSRRSTARAPAVTQSAFLAYGGYQPTTTPPPPPSSTYSSPAYSIPPIPAQAATSGLPLPSTPSHFSQNGPQTHLWDGQPSTAGTDLHAPPYTSASSTVESNDYMPYAPNTAPSTTYSSHAPHSISAFKVPPPRSASVQSNTSSTYAPPGTTAIIYDPAKLSDSAPPRQRTPAIPSPEQKAPPFSPSVSARLSSLPDGEPTMRRAGSPASFRSPSRTASPEVPTHGLPRSQQSSPKKAARGISSYTSQPFALDRTSSPVPPQRTYTPQLASGAPLAINASTTSPTSDRILGPVTSVGNGHAIGSYDPYAPKELAPHTAEHTSPPSTYAHPPSKQPSSTMHPMPYSSMTKDVLRERSMSNGSSMSLNSTKPEDPYAPQQARRQTIDSMSGSHHHAYPQSQEGYASNTRLEPTVQEITVKPFQSAYAPSPSLLGANDTLGRTSSRIPVFSFGFGGKVVTCFHGGASLNTGFDVALSSKNSTGIYIRPIKALIPDSALEHSAAIFPGPLFLDPGETTSSIVRAGAAAQARSKKAKVSKYLEERAEELSRGLAYINPNSQEGRQCEGRLVLVKLLKVMVENDGRLSSSPQSDAATRAALLPHLEGALSTALESTITPATTFTSIPDPSSSDFIPSTYGPYSNPLGDNADPTISVTTLRGSALDKIQEFLLRGERRQAYHYALDQKLWAHAMVIASSIDKDAWKEVAQEFIRAELSVKDNHPHLGRPSQPSDDSSLTNGREGLKVAYSLYSGQGSTAVQELVPQTLLARAVGHLQVPSTNSQLTPRTPNFAAPTQLNSIPVESLSKWAETAAMMLSYPLTSEVSSALTALGDQLNAHQWVEAAHVCYLLSLQTSPLGGLGNPTARVILLGSRSPQVWPEFAKDQDALILSEVLEFALSLSPSTKGQDSFSGIAHLQAYKLIRTMYLADMGDMPHVNRYCEAITASLSKSSPYVTPALLEQIKALSDRMLGVSQTDKSSSWMSSKITKPSLDSIGGWLEGRFTELVTGGSETPTTAESTRLAEQTFSGPFTTISTTTSTSPSPQPSFTNTQVLAPPRVASAMHRASPYGPPPIDRASSAVDYLRRKPSPGPTAPRIASANASTTSFSQSPSFNHIAHEPDHLSTSSYQDMLTPKPPTEPTSDESQEYSGWWNSTAGENSATQTPTAATFHRVEESSLSSNNDGFISLMENVPYPVAQSAPKSAAATRSVQEDAEEEDLLSNPTKKEKYIEPSPAAPTQAPSSSSSNPPPVGQPAVPSNGSASWLSRWWKKDPAAPSGPIKASLGEASSFYYDKDLKRWVNKSAGAEDVPKPATPLPPPSRAQTASPGMAMRPPISSGPPTRPASAINLSTSPPKTMRIHPSLSDSAPLTAPPSRPKSQAARRNARSRYIDVLQQENSI